MVRQSHPIQFIHNPDPASLPQEIGEFLRRLGGPTLVVVDGRDNTRCRAVATLLHGNEPSGVKALLKWLRTGERPAVKLICLIASVQTALHEALFCHRDRKSTRLNSSHITISYAVFCLKKKKHNIYNNTRLFTM